MTDRSDTTGRTDARYEIASQADAPPVGQVESRKQRDVFAAIDLGTNNCRLLIARGDGRGGFRVIDAFSRSVKLGEGVGASGALSEGAVDRTLSALKVCAAKMRRAGVTYSRAVATQACREASNAAAFIRRIADETGIRMDIVAPSEEARLCAYGCAPLTDPDLEDAIVFDIGGGSTELVWLRRTPARAEVRSRMAAWVSVPIGVVSLAEKFAAGRLRSEDYPAMVRIADMAFDAALKAAGFLGPREGAAMHLLGTSGTVTTLAGIHLGLKRYDRNQVDGVWMSNADVHAVSDSLVSQDFAGRAAQPCVGQDRADLVLPGCAILEAIMNRYPCPRMRIADRGLREGMLLTLMSKAEKDRRRRWKRSRKSVSSTS